MLFHMLKQEVDHQVVIRNLSWKADHSQRVTLVHTSYFRLAGGNGHWLTACWHSFLAGLTTTLTTLGDLRLTMLILIFGWSGLHKNRFHLSKRNAFRQRQKFLRSMQQYTDHTWSLDAGINLTFQVSINVVLHNFKVQRKWYVDSDYLRFYRIQKKGEPQTEILALLNGSEFWGKVTLKYTEMWGETLCCYQYCLHCNIGLYFVKI